MIVMTTWWRRFRDALKRRKPDSAPTEEPIRTTDVGSTDVVASLGPEQLPSKEAAPPKNRSATEPRRRDPSAPAPTTDAILGLDLGTSSTKVVVRTPFVASGRAVAVPVAPHATGDARYLAPTALAQSDAGAVEIPGQSSNPSAWSSLKVALMDDPSSLDAQAKVAAYLALIGRGAQHWYLQTQRDVVRSYALRWRWNLGIPSSGWETAGPMEAAFLTSLAAAKRMAERDEPIRLEDAHNLVAEGVQADESVDIIPEVVAAVVGYARSHLRERGLHFLVDVGASTLDFCAIILHERQGEDNYSILTALVDRSGLHELHRARLHALEGVPPNKLQVQAIELDLSNPLSRIPARIRNYFASPRACPKTISVDETFMRQCVTQVMKCIVHVRKYRYPTSPEWESGIPVFLCGGGATCGFYESVLEAASRRCSENFAGCSPLRIIQLPVPPQLDNPDMTPSTFTRLAVAYGLSFDRFDIGPIMGPDEIPDITRPTRPRREAAITKDQV